MKIHCPRAQQLSAELVSRWHEILAGTPQLAGPYFRPEFTAAVATVREDVEVAVLEDAGQIVGFFPFQRNRWNVAQPVAGRLSDYQAVIAAPDTPWQPDQIMSACRLAAWEFDHQLIWQPQLQPFFGKVAISPVIDVAHGYERWLDGRKAAGGAIKETLRKLRKLERESQKLEFEWHTTDRRVFEQLLAWKSGQFARTGARDIFASDWASRLLGRLRTTSLPHLSGVLSVLRTGDKILAIHFGLQSAGTLHSWFPAYDPEQSRCSPGQVLLLKLAEQAAAHGVARIDLGKGNEDYKIALASDFVEVAEGAIDRRPLGRAIRTGWSATRDWVKQSPLREPAARSVRWLRSVSDWLSRKRAKESSP